LLVIEFTIAFSILVRTWMAPIFPIDLHQANFEGMQLAGLALPVAYALGGLYPGYGMTGVQRLQSCVSLTALCFGAMILFDYLAQKGLWSRGILVLAGLQATVLLPICNAVIIQFLIRRNMWGMPVAVFGPPEQRRIMIDVLARQPELGWVPVTEASAPDAPLAGRAAANLAIIVTSPTQSISFRSLEDLPFRKVVLIPNLTESQSLWVCARDLGGLIGLEMRRNLLIPGIQRVKRMLDLIAISILAVPAGLITASAALIVQIVNPGPVFFTQVRDGRDGRLFRMVKLRTMIPDAETRLNTLLATDAAARDEWARTMKLKRDPRIIPIVGNLMRRFSVDELPQLWNVLCGDMSLVGPRPLPSYHLAALAPDVRRLRSRVRPGITGLWQVSGRSELALAEQQQLDVYYVRNWSLWLDIHILGRTILAVIKGRGAH
jgi:Undecaprenyl-phosphate galactose phosphotransferase WbaP